MEYKPDKIEINLLVGRSGCIINEMKKKTEVMINKPC